MSNKPKAIPDGYHNVTPYLIVNDAAAAIEFYKKAFGATELMRMPKPNGKIGHAEIRIGDSPIMLADEAPEMGARSPRTFGGSPVSIFLYVDDVDTTFARAVDGGAKVQRPLADQFYGDRTGGVEDPFGHVWYIATHVEDVSPEEMKKRAAAAGYYELWIEGSWYPSAAVL
jgi:PhnB protein